MEMIKLIEQAQFLLDRKLGVSTVTCALIETFDVTPMVAEVATEQALFLLELHRDSNETEG